MCVCVSVCGCTCACYRGSDTALEGNTTLSQEHRGGFVVHGGELGGAVDRPIERGCEGWVRLVAE